MHETINRELSFLPEEVKIKDALRLSASEKKHLEMAAEIIRDGGVVALPFNGIFGLFGDVDKKEVADKIIIAKNRPKDRKLIVVSAPEYIGEHVDLSKNGLSHQNIVSLWKDIHALGIIFHASTRAPYHLVVRDQIDTILSIWTEYKPVRDIMEHFRKLGGRAFVGTSANKSGQPTHCSPNTLWEDFRIDVDAVVETTFDHLPAHRLKSTTVIDLTNHQPVLHRLGNVGVEELKEALEKHGFPKLTTLRDVIHVRGRSE